EIYPGKIIAVNDADFDGDGIPDFADGFDAFADSAEDDEIKTAGAEPASFYPVILEIKEPLNPDRIRLRLSYSASDPQKVERRGDQENGYTYKPGPGKLRLWTKNAVEKRNKKAVSEEGDFVSPGEYAGESLARLGLAAGSRLMRFWLEGIDTGADLIIAEVDPDGEDGPADYMLLDAVKATVIQMQFVIPGPGYNHGENPDAEPVPTEFVGVSDPRPTVAITRQSAYASANTVTLAVEGETRDPILDNLPPALHANYLGPLSISLNGETRDSAEITAGEDSAKGFWGAA
ncbi:MAG: hypothetical protein N3A66_07435, partial [Planctomycetota bacterium]|nr:hypothetical protein [Planctomycetota bacterium]